MLTSTANGFLYVSVDDVEYEFTKYQYAQNSAAPAYLVTRIKEPGKPAITFNRKTNTSLTELGNITSITASDGSLVQFNYTNDRQLSSLTMDGGRTVSFGFHPSTPGGPNLLKYIKHTNPTGTEMVRQFTYSDQRILQDTYRTAVDAATFLQRTDFTYLDSDPDGASNPFTNPAKTLKGVTFGQNTASQSAMTYEIRPAINAGYVLNDFSFSNMFGTNFPSTSSRVTQIRLDASDLARYDESFDQSQVFGSGAAHVKVLRFDNASRIRSEESRFFDNGGSFDDDSGLLLSQTITTYDHLGNVKTTQLYDTYRDWTSTSASPAAKRSTLSKYDYEILPTYLRDVDPTTPDVEPKYDSNDYRGNLVSFTDYTGTQTFKYETDDELLLAVGKPIESKNQLGARTTFVHDTKGRLTNQTSVRRNVFTQTEESANEVWSFGVEAAGVDNRLVSYTNAIGLVTGYVYDSKRRIDTVTTTDAGYKPLGTNTFTDPEVTTVKTTYDAFGFVDTITTKVDGQVRSVVDADADALGLTLKQQIKDGTNLLSQVTTTYRADGLPSTVTRLLNETGTNGTLSPKDTTDEYGYDLAGRQISVIEGKGATYPTAAAPNTPISIQQTTTTKYRRDGSIGLVTLPDSNTREYFADPLQFTQWTKTSGVAGDSQFDSSGGAITVDLIDQVMAETTDFLGRTLKRRDLLVGESSGDRLIYQYEDPRVDKPTKVTEKNLLDIAGTVQSRTTDIKYDPLGRVLQTLEPGHQAISRIEYDDFGNVAISEVLATKGSRHEYTTDLLGNVLEHREIRRGSDRNMAPTQQTLVEQMAYDQLGRVRQAKDAELQTRKIDYGMVLVAPGVYQMQVDNTDRDGLTAKSNFDALDREVRSENYLGGVSSTVFNAGGQAITSTLPDNGSAIRTVTTRYDQFDRARVMETTVVSPNNSGNNGAIKQSTDYFTTDQSKWDVIATDARGYQTKSMLDSTGKTIAVQQPAPDTVNSGGQAMTPDFAPLTIYQYRYNLPQSTYEVRVNSTIGDAAADRPTVLANSMPVRISSDVYSESGRMLEHSELNVNNALTTRVTNTYGMHGQLDVSTDADGNPTSYLYDLDGGATATGKVEDVKHGDSPTSERTHYVYDSSGNLTHEYSVVTGAAIYRTYDKIGRLATETRKIDSSATGGAGTARDAVRAWQYPVTPGKVVSVLTDRNGAVTTTTLDPVAKQRQIAVTSGASSSIVSTYTRTEDLNLDGSLKQVSDKTTIAQQATRSQSALSFAYDTLGRVERTEQATAFQQVAGPALRNTVTYNANSALAQNKVRFATSSLNAAGDPTTAGVTWTDLLNENFSYDALGRLVKAEQDLASVAAPSWVGNVVGYDKQAFISYNHLGERAVVQRKSRIPGQPTFTDTGRSIYLYTLDGKPQSVTHNSSGNGFADVVQYINTYTGAGRIETRTVNYFDGVSSTAVRSEVATHAYDTTGRLSTVTYTQGTPNEQYNWDQEGNRQVNNQVYGLENRLRSDDHFTYGYDSEGNLTGRYSKDNASKSLYFYDAVNRLAAVEEYDTNGQKVLAVDYGYDAANHRFASRTQQFSGGVPSPATLSFQVSTSDDPVVRFNSQMKIDQAYFNDPQSSELLAVDVTNASSGTKTYWGFGSGAGTMGAWVTRNGSSIQVGHILYDSYGNVLANPSQLSSLGVDPALPRVWSDMRMETSVGMYNSGATWYRPELGMYLTQVNHDDLLNPYRFAGGDPVSLTSKTSLVNVADRPYDPTAGVYGFGQRFIGETVRGLVGNDRLAGASDASLIAGTVAASTAIVLGVWFGGPALLSAASAAGSGLTSLLVGLGLSGTSVFVAKQTILATVQTSAEAAIAGAVGDQSFSTLGSFARNMAFNFTVGLLPGGAEIKTASVLMRAARYGGRFALEVGAETAFDTTWEVGVNGRNASDALTQSLVANTIGQVVGDSVSFGMRKRLESLGVPQVGRLCFTGDTPIWMIDAAGTPATKPIESIDLGELVYQADAPVSDRESPESTDTLLRIRLRALGADNQDVAIELLRSPEWLASAIVRQPKLAVAVGDANTTADINGSEHALVHIAIPELNLDGLAYVQSVEPVTVTSNADGLVTGLFHHIAPAVLSLEFEGLQEPIRSTVRHPFWSLTRSDWIAAEDLTIGEHVRCFSGDTVLQRVTIQHSPTLVYNIEVSGEHRYWVSSLGILVHNASESAAGGSDGFVSIDQLQASARQLQARRYLGQHYGQAKSLHAADPEFFPDPDNTLFRATTGSKLDAARAAFVDSGLRGHHVHPLAHGGPAIPGPGGLAFTGESTIRASQLAGLDLGFYVQYGKANAKVLKIYQPKPGGLYFFGPNPRHTQATNFWNQVGRTQRGIGTRL